MSGGAALVTLRISLSMGWTNITDSGDDALDGGLPQSASAAPCRGLAGEWPTLDPVLAVVPVSETRNSHGVTLRVPIVDGQKCGIAYQLG